MENTRKKPDFTIPGNKDSKITKIIGVVSGKGGVGKSLVTSLLASDMAKKGYKVGIMDADITGPSIPRYFGLEGRALADEEGQILPMTAENGVKVMSVNLVVEHAEDPVVWRGPILANAVKQFYTDVVWGELDYLFVDMPPGTGDVPLTVFQSLPIDGIVVVTSPSDLVGMIVAKAITMAKRMGINIVGAVENMSYLQCPDCSKKIDVFGKSKVEEIKKDTGIEIVSRIPIDPKISSATDAGRIFDVNEEFMEDIIVEMEKIEPKEKK